MKHVTITMQTGFLECWLAVLSKIEDKYPFSQVSIRKEGALFFSLVTSDLDLFFLGSLGDYVLDVKVED